MSAEHPVLRSAVRALALSLSLASFGATAVHAQRPVRDVDGPIEPVAIDLQEGTMERGALPVRNPWDTYCFISTDHVGLFTTPLAGESETIVDWGVMGGTASTGCTDITSIATRLDFGYATKALDPGVGGPGASVNLSIYTDYEGFGVDSGNMPVASFAFTGLPGLSGSTTGGGAGFFVGVDLSLGFEVWIPNGKVALGFASGDADAGDGFASTGPILCTVPPYPTPDSATGQVDRADAWLPDTAGVYDGSFGGNENASWMWGVARADLAAYPATVSFRNGGTNPPVYTATRPIMGDTIHASVDLTVTGHLSALIVGFDTAVNIPIGNGKTLLILDMGETEMLFQTFQPGPIATFSLPVPIHMGNLGKHVYTQGLMVAPGQPFGLTNAQDFVVGADVDIPPVLAPTGLVYAPPGPYTFEIDLPVDALVPTIQGTAPFTWNVYPPLPAGLSLDGDGNVVGTPTVLTPPTTYTISAFNGAGQDSIDLEIEVIAAVQPPTTLTYSPPGPFVVPEGSVFGPLVPAVDGDPPFTWTSTPPLSAGLALSNTGVISGLAVVAGGPTEYTIEASNSAGAASTAVTITIIAPPAGLSYPTPPVLLVGTPIDPLVPTVGGGIPTAWSSSPPLPAGLSLDASGTITGTPTEASPLTDYTITASNIAGFTTFDLPLQVDTTPPGTITYSPNPFGAIINTGPHQLVPSVSGGGPIDTWEVVGGSLPPIMTLDPETGVIAGYPTQVYEPAHLQIRGSNAAGSSTVDLTLEVSGAPPPSDLQYIPGSPSPFQMGVPITPIVPTISTQVARFTIDPPLPNEVLPGGGSVVTAQTGVIQPDNPAPISYPPPEQTSSHPWQTLNVWLPQGTPPASGWPVVVANYSSGYFGHPGIDEIDPENPISLVFHMALNEGIAVVIAGITDAGPVSGWFYPPGHPSGRWEDPDYFMPEKDYLHALQWVKVQDTYALDPNRVFAYGVSSGSTIASYVTLGPDRRQETGSEQVRASSRVRGVLAFDTLFSFAAYRDDTVVAAMHWESVTNPGLSAATFGDADPALRDAASIARVILDPLSMAATTPVFLAYDCPQGAAEYYNQPDGFPSLDQEIMENIHDLWNGAKFFERLRYLNGGFHSIHSEFFVGNGHEVGLGSLAGTETGYFVGGVLDSALLYAYAVDWMRTRADETFVDPEGLQIHPKSGYIFGTPTIDAPTRTYTVTAQNAAGTDTATVSIGVQK